MRFFKTVVLLPLTVTLALVLTAPLAAAAPQACASGPPHQLGRVRVLPDACTGGLGTLPRTTCQVVRVECQGIPEIDAELRTVEPASGIPIRGTVVMGVGGGGVGFYGDRVGGLEIQQALLDEGFRIVDRSWRRAWFGDDSGVKRQSCRYATLITWIQGNVHTAGSFCVTGNSGGSGEICYALGTWGRGDIIDVAVPTGGPPMARLDYLCLDPPAWQALCGTLVPSNVSNCTQQACTTHPNNQVCISCSSNATLADLEADSILHPGAVTDYPATRVHSILGADDCGSAVPMGILFSQAITSERVLEWAPNTPHWTATSVEGQEAIVRAILGGAACDPGPATLAASSWPQVGGSADLELFGPASTPYSIHWSFGTTMIEIANLGWQFLEPPIGNVAAGTLDASGASTETASVPSNLALIGRDVYAQARIDGCLSNLVHVRILS